MKQNQEKFVIGVDGGGTKTTAALANLKGKIIKKNTTGPSNLRNLGIKKAVENIAKAIELILKKGKIISTYIALPCLEEEFKYKKSIILQELKKYKKIAPIFQGKVTIDSDQVAAYFSGTDKKDGLILIAGTGSVVRGWLDNKTFKIGGWGWLSDDGSSFLTGQKGIQAVLKDLDGRGPKTLMTNLVLKKWKIKKPEDLLKKIYNQEIIKNVSLFSIIIDEAANKNDQIAKNILNSTAQELAKITNYLIKKINFKEKVPLVLVGGMFKSKIVLNIFKKEIKHPVEFITPKNKPINGSIKLAIKKSCYL